MSQIHTSAYTFPPTTESIFILQCHWLHLYLPNVIAHVCLLPWAEENDLCFYIYLENLHAISSPA